MYKSPKTSIVNKNDIGLGSLQVSGKNVFAGKKDFNNSNFNEFTFTPKNPEEVARASGTLNRPRNPLERSTVTDRNPDAPVQKDEIFHLLGITNPKAEEVKDLKIDNFMGMSSGVARSKDDVSKNVIGNLEAEIEKLKKKKDEYLAEKERKKREQMEQSHRRPPAPETHIVLHEDLGRMQQIEHTISSLEKPTLDNVGALLRAHREKMQGIEQKYVDMRKQQMLESDSGSSYITAPHPLLYEDHVRQGKENQAVRRPKSFKEYTWMKEIPKRDVNAEAIRIQQKKEDQRDYVERYEDYRRDKEEALDMPAPAPVAMTTSAKKGFDRYQPTSPNPKRSKSRNKWDGDNFIEHNTSRRSQSPPNDTFQSSKSGNLRQVTRSEHSDQESPRGSFYKLSNKRASFTAGSPKKLRSQQTMLEGGQDFSESEIKLLQWIFNIMRKNPDIDSVDKEDICDYVLKSQDILNLYQIDPATLRSNIYAFSTANRDAVSFDEFLTFLHYSRLIAQGKMESMNNTRQSLLKRSPSRTGRASVRFNDSKGSPRKNSKTENVCVLADETIEVMKEIFHDVDRFDDLIVKRQTLIKKVREDVRIVRILHKPAVHIQEIDKYLSMERLLRQIEEEETNAISDQKKSKEYISLNQFMKYFTNYETPDDLAEKMGEKLTQNRSARGARNVTEEDDQDIIDVANKHMDFFKKKFGMMPKRRGAYVETLAFLDSVRSDDQYILARRDPARRKSVSYELKDELLEAVINRIEDEAEKFISWEDFVTFFTRRGRPKRLMTSTYNVEEDLIKAGVASQPKDQGQQTGAKVVQNAQRDGYDSDPEFHTYGKNINYEFKLNRGTGATLDFRDDYRDDQDLADKRPRRTSTSPPRNSGTQMSPIRLKRIEMSPTGAARKSPRDHFRDSFSKSKPTFSPLRRDSKRQGSPPRADRDYDEPRDRARRSFSKENKGQGSQTRDYDDPRDRARRSFTKENKGQGSPTRLDRGYDDFQDHARRSFSKENKGQGSQTRLDRDYDDSRDRARRSFSKENKGQGFQSRLDRDYDDSKDRARRSFSKENKGQGSPTRLDRNRRSFSREEKGPESMTRLDKGHRDSRDGFRRSISREERGQDPMTGLDKGFGDSKDRFRHSFSREDREQNSPTRANREAGSPGRDKKHHSYTRDDREHDFARDRDYDPYSRHERDQKYSTQSDREEEKRGSKSPTRTDKYHQGITKSEKVTRSPLRAGKPVVSFYDMNQIHSLDDIDALEAQQYSDESSDEDDRRGRASAQHYQSAKLEKLNYTVPDPFEFESRGKNRSKSIRERRVEDMVNEKLDEEERRRTFQFRAKSVPYIVTEPLFDKLKHEEQKRRSQVKKNSVAITKMREAPFSFYQRDKQKHLEKQKQPEQRLNNEFGKKFKASPIPAICQLTDVWKHMKDRDDVERKERVARLAQQNLLLASLPPRMAKHEKAKREQDLRAQINERNTERQQDKKTFLANEVPDFKRLHKQFQTNLDRNRRNKRPTETQPFNFQESRKGVARDYLDTENQYRKAAKDDMRRDPFESVEKLKATKPKIQPHTTKKMIALNDQRRKEREEKKRREEQLEREEEERKARQAKMKEVVKNSASIQARAAASQENEKKAQNDVKKRFIEDQRQYDEKMREMQERVAKRPLMVDQEAEKNRKLEIQAMKDLQKLNSIMKEAGVRDPKKFMTQEERDKLEDAEYLAKKGYKDVL